VPLFFRLLDQGLTRHMFYDSIDIGIKSPFKTEVIELMSRKESTVRCDCCGAWFDPRTYSGALIEGKTLCKACAKSSGLWVPVIRRVGRSKENKSVQTDESPEITMNTLELVYQK